MESLQGNLCPQDGKTINDLSIEKINIRKPLISQISIKENTTFINEISNGARSIISTFDMNDNHKEIMNNVISTATNAAKKSNIDKNTFKNVFNNGINIATNAAKKQNVETNKNFITRNLNKTAISAASYGAKSLTKNNSITKKIFNTALSKFIPNNSKKGGTRKRKNKQKNNIYKK
jgi:hypothetical protein